MGNLIREWRCLAALRMGKKKRVSDSVDESGVDVGSEILCPRWLVYGED